MKTRNLKKKSKKLRNLILLTSLCAILSCASGGGGGGGGTANNTPSNPDKPSNINTAPSKPNPGTPAPKPDSNPETVKPTKPQDPGNPTKPQDPGNPTKPQDPGNPIKPQDPGNPIKPQDPGNPIKPQDPPQDPVKPIKRNPTPRSIPKKQPPADKPKLQNLGSASKLDVDRNINLDDSSSSSSSSSSYLSDMATHPIIHLLKDKKITGTRDNQNAIKSDLFADNHGIIKLTGKNTVGMSSQIVYNRGFIKVGENSIAQHAVYKDVKDVEDNYERFIINEGIIELGKNSTGIRMDKEYNNINGFANNYGTITSNAANVTGIMASIKDVKHSKDNPNLISYIDNDGEINLSGDKSKGMYAEGKGKMKMRNRNKIIIGDSSDKNDPSIAMHSSNPENETINDGIIEVGKNSRGMSETNGGRLTNNQEIIIKGENGVGMYLANGSKGVNNGTIELNAKNAIGVVLDANSEFTNNGNIIINSDRGIGILANGGIVNNTGYFEIKSKNSTGVLNKGGKVIGTKEAFIVVKGNSSNGIVSSGDHKTSENNIIVEGSGSNGIVTSGNGEMSGNNVIIRGSGSSGISLRSSTKAIAAKDLPARRSLGIYVNSLGKTNPIEGLANLGLDSADLLIGAEVTEKTNDTEVTVGSNVLDPFNNSNNTSNIPNWTVKSYSLIWEADPEIKDGRIEKVTLKKQSYAKFADENTEGVAKALDEKYIMASEKDKQIFNYMNKLRDAESLRRVYREVRGNQYTNVQQRINQTDNLLDKQILSLQKDNADKAGHHVETFFDRNKHDFETNEVPDTKNTAYGVSYLFNNTDNNWGLYGGVVINRYKFKDIAHSKENITMFKLGGYKKYELNNFDWTFGGDVFISQNSMKRRFMVGNIYENKADYNAYGFSIKNEISKTYELGENGTIKPYGTLKLGYGNFERIKEKDGTFKLDVKGNSYYSVKPSVGVEVAYTKEITDKTKLKASLDLAYEHELGKIDHKKNEIKYVDTNRTYKLSAKDENRGNFRSGVKVGMEIGNFNFSVNGGYDTKDKNARIGVGFGTSF